MYVGQEAVCRQHGAWVPTSFEAWMFSDRLLSCEVQAFTRTDPSSKESYQMPYNIHTSKLKGSVLIYLLPHSATIIVA